MYPHNQVDHAYILTLTLLSENMWKNVDTLATVKYIEGFIVIYFSLRDSHNCFEIPVGSKQIVKLQTGKPSPIFPCWPS